MPHIARESKIVHDGDNSHGILIERLGLKSEVHPASETAGLSDKSDNEHKALAIFGMAVKKRVRLRYREWGGKEKPDDK